MRAVPTIPTLRQRKAKELVTQDPSLSNDSVRRLSWKESLQFLRTARRRYLALVKINTNK